MEPKRSCCIDRCLTKTKSIKVKDIIFYLYPTDDEWANQWEKTIKEFDPTYKRRPDDIICSLHFAKASMLPYTRKLCDHAVPIYFPPPISAPAKNPPISQKPPIPQNTDLIRSKCCIVGCPTKFNDPNSKIHGFSFPDDEKKRNHWIFIIEIYNKQKIKWHESMQICALHFPAANIDKDNKLLPVAKPSIFSHGIAKRQLEIDKQNKQAQANQSNLQVQPKPPTLPTQANHTNQLRRQIQAQSQLRPKPQLQPQAQAQAQAQLQLKPKPLPQNPVQPNQLKQLTRINRLKQHPQPQMQTNQSQLLEQKKNRHSAPLKIQSINVPLHKSNPDQLLTQRSAPIMARRLSLPYNKLPQLPKLIPKPNIVRQLDQAQVSGQNGVNVLKRISTSNGDIPTKTVKIAPRPVPALNKVVNVANVPMKVVENNAPKVLRLSMPPPSTLTEKVQPIVKHINGKTLIQVPSITYSRDSTTVRQRLAQIRGQTLKAVKAVDIKNMPTKPATVLRAQSNSALKTYTKDPKDVYVEQLSTMPIITRVQNGPQVYELNLSDISTASHNTEMIENANTSSQFGEEYRISDVIVIEDEDADIAKAIDESRTDAAIADELSKCSDDAGNELAYKFPNLLLERILTNKRINAELKIEEMRLKKIYIKSKQQLRLQNATVINETIEIS